MKRVTGMLIVMIFGLVFSISPGLAEETEKEITLEPTVVTATRTEKEVGMAPASTSVVTKQDIEMRNTQAVDEALDDLPGVFERRGKGLMDTLSSVTIRGIPGQQRTLILLDGLPLNSAYDGTVTFAGLAPEDVERIEVVRGPVSSLYGSYAMGGVVNILTKMPQKREVTLKQGYGSDNYWSTYGSYGDKFKDLSLFVSAGYRSTAGYITNFDVQSSKPPAGITGWWPTSSSQGQRRYLIGDSGKNGWYDANLTAKIEYNFTETSKLRLSYLRTQDGYNYGDPDTYLLNASGKPIFSYGSVKESTFLSGNGGKIQNLFNLGYETKFSDIKVKLLLGCNQLEDNWYITPGSTSATTQFGGPGTLSSTPSINYNADLQFTAPLVLPFVGKHVLTWGGSYRYDSANTKEHQLYNWKDENSQTALSFQSRGKDMNFALFAQDEIPILNNLTAYIGFREDWWRVFDGFANSVGLPGYPQDFSSRTASSFSPKGALVYNPFKGTILRTSVGKAFGAPSIYDLFRTWTTSYGVTYHSNPYLKPETSLSWDVGAEQGLWKGALVKATYFENYVDDLIYLRTVDATNMQYINVGKATIKGVEFAAEQKFDFGLRLFTNFTYNDTKVVKNSINPLSEGKQLTQTPKELFNIGGEWTIGPISARLVGRYVAKRYSDDRNRDTVNHVYGSYDPYFVADAKLSYKLTMYGMSGIASLAVDNIFNRDYFTYYKSPGRQWFSDLTIKF
ncbi:MAG TPA: TonB-dependent receptor [Thermodesulfobacteriota bacterium]|nr:TonB-dependent receptor [Thermodesulfobacteriota bacterium]